MHRNWNKTPLIIKNQQYKRILPGRNGISDRNTSQTTASDNSVLSETNG